MGAVAMAKAATLQIRGRVEVRELHWLLWAEAERAGAWQGPRQSGQWHFVPSADDQPRSVRALVAWSPRDDDIADAVGQGVERLGQMFPEKARAIRARYSAASDVIYMRDLARNLGLTPARISQMADEGQSVVERWVVEIYGER